MPDRAVGGGEAAAAARDRPAHGMQAAGEALAQQHDGRRSYQNSQTRIDNIHNYTPNHNSILELYHHSFGRYLRNRYNMQSRAGDFPARNYQSMSITKANVFSGIPTRIACNRVHLEDVPNASDNHEHGYTHTLQLCMHMNIVCVCVCVYMHVHAQTQARSNLDVPIRDIC